MKKTTIYFCVIIIVSLLVFSSCVGLGGWEYDIEDGVFKTENADLIMDFRNLDGEITVNGETILLSIGVDNDLRGVDISEHMIGPGGVSDDDILVKFRVESNKKDRTLKLTTIGGSLMDSVDTEYILHFCEGETYRIG